MTGSQPRRPASSPVGRAVVLLTVFLGVSVAGATVAGSAATLPVLEGGRVQVIEPTTTTVTSAKTDLDIDITDDTGSLESTPERTDGQPHDTAVGEVADDTTSASDEVRPIGAEGHEAPTGTEITETGVTPPDKVDSAAINPPPTQVELVLSPDDAPDGAPAETVAGDGFRPAKRLAGSGEGGNRR